MSWLTFFWEMNPRHYDGGNQMMPAKNSIYLRILRDRFKTASNSLINTLHTRVVNLITNVQMT